MPCRIVRAAATAAAALLVAASAGLSSAASDSNAVADCTQSAEPVRAIDGCTALLDGDRLDVKIRAAVLHLRGAAHQAQGSIDLAIGDFAAASRLDPAEPALFAGLAVAVADLGRRCFEETAETAVIQGCSALLANAEPIGVAEEVVARARATRKAALERLAATRSIAIDPPAPAAPLAATSPDGRDRKPSSSGAAEPAGTPDGLDISANAEEARPIAAPVDAAPSGATAAAVSANSEETLFSAGGPEAASADPAAVTGSDPAQATSADAVNPAKAASSKAERRRGAKALSRSARQRGLASAGAGRVDRAFVNLQAAGGPDGAAPRRR